MPHTDDCMRCTQPCPQAKLAHETAKGRMYATNELLSYVKKVDSGQLVEVVRCKDCKHWKKQDFQAGNDPEHLEYGGYCPNARFARYESDFCSYGERKDGDG